MSEWMSAAAEELRAAVEQLQAAYDTAASEVSTQARTPDGRYVLLDALTALVNGRAELGKAAEEASTEIELICSVCLYVRPRPGLDEDTLAETTMLTIINGQMVCVRHAGCASSTGHSTVANGVHLESQGQLTSLSAYQDWHYKQRKAAEEAAP